jgi:hypothetical protein
MWFKTMSIPEIGQIGSYRFFEHKAIINSQQNKFQKLVRMATEAELKKLMLKWINQQLAISGCVISVNLFCFWRYWKWLILD